MVSFYYINNINAILIIMKNRLLEVKRRIKYLNLFWKKCFLNINFEVYETYIMILQLIYKILVCGCVWI